MLGIIVCISLLLNILEIIAIIWIVDELMQMERF